MKRNLLAAAVLVVAGLFADVPKVIFDTDMYTDFDDVGALAVLHSLADAGECEILGTVVSTRKRSQHPVRQIPDTQCFWRRDSGFPVRFGQVPRYICAPCWQG